jgi:hypothetical protein
MSRSSVRRRVVDVREMWRAYSLAEVWPCPGGWYDPAVDALVEAVEEGRSPHTAAQRLGIARRAAGIGIGEALDDVMSLYRATGRPVDVETLRSMAIGWAHGRDRLPDAPDVRDAATGLPTVGTLVQRLHEAHRAAARSGTDVTETHCLLLVDAAIDGLDAWERKSRSAVVGRSLDQMFGNDYPIAAVTESLFAVVCERREVAYVARSVRRVVDRNAEILGLPEPTRRSSSVWVESLPARPEAAVQLLIQLAH